MQRGRHEETPSQLLMPVTSWISDTTPIAARRKEVAFIMNESNPFILWQEKMGLYETTACSVIRRDFGWKRLD